MVKARSNDRTLLLVLVTTPSEGSELINFRKERLEKIGEQSTDYFSSIETKTVAFNQLDKLALPKRGWIFFLKPWEIPLPNILEAAAVGFDSYDAIWGGVLVQNENTSALEHIEGTMFGCTELPKVMFRDPETWLHSSFYLRAEKANSAQLASEFDIDFYLDIWREGHSIKLGRPFVIQNTNINYKRIRKKIISYFRRTPIVKRFNFDNEELAFRIAYWNPYMESTLVSGHLCEDTQLLALKEFVPHGATIVDVGANIGQHTIFFAKNLRAKKVIPIEPNPDLVNIIKENIALNNVSNVDCTLLGIGVGAEEGQCQVITSEVNPNDTVVEYIQTGEIPVFPLDELVKEDVHLVKIDVDESELQVIRGMEKILEVTRPILVIEVVHKYLSEFLLTMDKFDYRVDQLFPNPQYSDIIALPREYDGGSAN